MYKDQTDCIMVQELSSNHEYEDTKIVYLLKHAIESEEDPDITAFVLTSNSGGTD